ncbi:uncharacterized protein LOC123538708 [Mercenaria mercenaria]|uniref:uncharacterized protein LOC123538708 n=1 Tax=Mercenaria mercenaria TaxID=6596 RepID=UPI00234E52FC|nr:uncharacterized protein LOC123538708 [Mercenaria mercenaria]
MLQSKTGVSSLRRRFEQSQQSHGREGLKRKIGLEPTNDKKTLHTSKTETHEKEYIKVLEGDVSTNISSEQTVITGSTTGTDIPDEDRADRIEECRPSQASKDTISKSDHGDNHLIKETDDFENENTNTKMIEHMVDPLGKKADQPAKAHTIESITTNTGPSMTKQIDEQNTTSSQEQAESYHANVTNTDKEEQTQGHVKNNNANMIGTLQQETPDDQIEGNTKEITNEEIGSFSTIAINNAKVDPHNTGDQEEKIKQATNQNVVTHLDTREANKVHKTEQNRKHTQRGTEPKPNITSYIAEKASNAKPSKPPLPPKPTERTGAILSQLKRSSNETTVKRNDGHSAQTSVKKFARKRKLHRYSRFDTRSSTSDSVISSTTATSEESMENKCHVQYMAEVYRDCIKHQVRVEDLLPLLPLGKYETEIINSKQKSCPPDAVELLLDIMTMSDIPGIWQSFLDALETLEYIHLSKLLRNETEIHHSHSSDILKLVTHDLQQRICFPDFLDAVYERELLVQSEYEEADTVYRARGSQTAASVIIEGVAKHLPNWDEVFADILEQSGMADIAELFKFVEQQQSYCSQGEGFTEISKMEKIQKQKKLHEQRIQFWKERNSELQPTFSEAGFDARKKTTAGSKNIDFNALCITVSQIQSEMKLLTRGMEDLKMMQSEILQRFQKC